MGLIKTAVIAGAGIYAVNKITKAAENRRTNPAPVAAQDYNSHQQYLDAPPYYSPGPSQGGRAQEKQQPPQLHQPREKVVPMEFTERRGQQPQQQQQQQQQQHQSQPQVLLTNNNAYSPLPSGYNSQGEYNYEMDPRAAPPPADMYAGSAPPSHYQSWRQQRQQGFVEPDEVSVSASDGSSRGRNTAGTGLFNTLAQQAMNMKDGKGKDFVGKYLFK